MVELVDTRDLKSLGHYGRAGSSPALRTRIEMPTPLIGGGLFLDSRTIIERAGGKTLLLASISSPV